MHRLLELLRPLPPPVDVIPHSLADVDALASAIGIQKILEAMGKEVNVVAPSLTSEASLLVDSFELQLLQERKGASAVVVDASDPSMVEVQLPEQVVVVDHHPTNSWDVPKYVEERGSCSEIVFNALNSLGVYDRTTYTLLLLGIYTDTAGLRVADWHSLETISKILNVLGGRLEEYVDILFRKRDISERIAMLKAMRRAEIYRVGDVVIVLTNVSAFEASAAMAAIKLGADVAIVFSEKRVSARATATFIRQYGSLLPLFEKVVEEVGGTFGGHDGAVGASTPDPERFARLLLNYLFTRLVGTPRKY